MFRMGDNGPAVPPTFDQEPFMQRPWWHSFSQLKVASMAYSFYAVHDAKFIAVLRNRSFTKQMAATRYQRTKINPYPVNGLPNIDPHWLYSPKFSGFSIFVGTMTTSIGWLRIYATIWPSNEQIDSVCRTEKSYYLTGINQSSAMTSQCAGEPLDRTCATFDITACE